MASEVEGRTAEDWQSLLAEMFPANVRVTATGENTPQFYARPIRVFDDPDSGGPLWVLGISESHAEYLSLKGATVDGTTLKVNAYGTTAVVRPSEQG